MGFDIYQWAKDYNYCADYMDPRNGNIYKVQQYGKDLKADPNAKIAVYDSYGNYLGNVLKKGENS